MALTASRVIAIVPATIAGLKFLIAASGGFRPQVADWVIRTKHTFGWEPIVLTSDREYTIAKAIHQWHGQEILHYVQTD